MQMIGAANLALRFLLELGGIVALAYWGYHAGSGMARWLLAILAPVVLVAVWAVLIAPGAENPVPQQARVLLGSGVLLLAAGALFMTGQRTLAVVFAVVIVVNTVLMFVVGEPDSLRR